MGQVVLWPPDNTLSYPRATEGPRATALVTDRPSTAQTEASRPRQGRAHQALCLTTHRGGTDQHVIYYKQCDMLRLPTTCSVRYQLF